MEEYDVIVVGAGPAGSAAAKTVAEQGLRVILLEENVEVGVPHHCCGLFYPQGVEPIRFVEFARTIDKRVKLAEYNKVRVFAPSGKVVKEDSVAGTGYCIFRRDNLDRELAREAVNAGANLRLNTRATGLLKQDGRVIGVTTNSTAVPNLYGKVVIGADGIHAIQRGTPKWAGLNRAGQKFIGGVSLDVTRVEDIEPDVFEIHYGAFSRLGLTWVCPYDNVSCTTTFMSLAEFEHVKTGNYAVSRKLRNAIPLRITGWSHAKNLGQPLSKVIEDGLILTGSAAGLIGNWAAIVSGGYAGVAAALAICEGDVTVKKLGKYEELCKELFEAATPFPTEFEGLSDEAIENALTQEEPFKT
jgi:flavin-dependent dehydrogenase